MSASCTRIKSALIKLTPLTIGYGLYHHTGLKKTFDTFAPAVGFLAQTGQPLVKTVENLELDKKIAAVGASVSSLVETVHAKSPEWKQSVDEVTAQVMPRIHTYRLATS